MLLADIVVKLPNYEICQTLEPYTWEWWWRNCWWYDSAAVASTVMVNTMPALMLGVMLLSLRQVQGPR